MLNCARAGVVCAAQDATLVALAEQIGKDWVRIAHFFGGRRSASNCSARWKEKVGGGLPPGGRKRLSARDAGTQNRERPVTGMEHDL